MVSDLKRTSSESELAHLRFVGGEIQCHVTYDVGGWTARAGTVAQVTVNGMPALTLATADGEAGDIQASAPLKLRPGTNDVSLTTNLFAGQPPSTRLHMRVTDSGRLVLDCSYQTDQPAQIINQSWKFVFK